MKNKFAVHYQTWKNEKATQFAIEKFREYFPNEQLRLISDNGSDYSHFIPKYNIDFEFLQKLCIKCKNFINQLEKEFANNNKSTKSKLKTIKNNKDNITTKFYMIIDKNK